MKLLQLLFENKPRDEHIIVRAFNENGKPTTKSSKTLDKLEPFIDKHRKTHDLYFSVCSSTTNNLESKNIKTAYAVWCDIDHTDVNTEILFALPPSVVLSSGNGLHCYWILDNPCSDLDRVEEANKIIIDLLGGDSGTWNRSRILRVDDSFNFKDRGNPKHVQIVNQLPVKYSIEDIEAACELTDNVVLKICKADRRGYSSRSERDFAIITQCIIEGMSDAGIEAIFKHQAIGDRYRENNQGSRYLGRSIVNAREVVGIDESKEPSKKSKKKAINGIIEQGNCYWLKTKQGKKKLSTFALHPRLVLSDLAGASPDIIKCEVVAENTNATSVIDIPKDVFTSIRLINKLLQDAHWQWLGSDAELRKVLPYIMHDVDEGMSKKYTTQLGKVQDCWISTEGSLNPSGQILDQSNSSIVYFGKKGFNVQTGFDDSSTTVKQKRQIVEILIEVNELSVIGPILGWSVASLMKTELHKLGHRSPFLNLYGTKGSGKTTTIQKIIQPLTGYISTSSIDCNTTLFSLLSIFSASTEVPIYLSEYRSHLSKSGTHLHRLLLLLYDRAEDYRGNADQSMTAYPLTAPIVLDGNDPVNDTALLERTIQIQFTKSNLQKIELQENLDKVTELNLSAFFTGLVTYVLNVTTKELKQYYKDASNIFDEAFKHLKLDIRVKHNHTIVLLGLLVLYDYVKMQMSLDIKELFSNSLDNIVSSTGSTIMQFDMFVEDLVTAIADTTIYTNNSNPKYREDGNILWIHLKTCLNWWIAHRQRLNMDTLDLRAIKAQVKDRLGNEEEHYLIPAKSVTIDRKAWHCIGVNLDKAKLIMELPE